MKESQSSVETGSYAQLSKTEATIWQILDLTMLVQHCNCYSFIPRKDIMGSKNRVPKWGPKTRSQNMALKWEPNTRSQNRVSKKSPKTGPKIRSHNGVPLFDHKGQRMHRSGLLLPPAVLLWPLNNQNFITCHSSMQEFALLCCFDRSITKKILVLQIGHCSMLETLVVEFALIELL